MVTSLEVDFNVAIITSHSIDQYDSIAKLTSLLKQIVDASELAAFEGRWSG
jgi:hypothetical protein